MAVDGDVIVQHSPGPLAAREIGPIAVNRQVLVGRVIVVDSQADLFEIVAALHPPRRFARRLNGRQQKSHEDADDGDHHEQLDQRETSPITIHLNTPDMEKNPRKEFGGPHRRP